jgi:hypothetical protein
MDHFAEASKLVAFLGEYTKNPDLALDRDGRCTADIEGIRFSFFYEAGFDALFIQAALGAPTPGALEALMLSNQLWEGTAGGIFGLNPEDGHIYYSYRLDFPLAEEPVYEEFLCDLLAGIVGAIEAAMDEITSVGPNLPTASDGFNPANAV